MKDDEVKVQIMKIKEQWASGLLFGLEWIDDQGLTLSTRPAAPQLLTLPNKITQPIALAVDECCRIWFIDSKSGLLHSYDSQTDYFEQVRCFGGYGPEAGKFIAPIKVMLDELKLWVLDAGANSLQAFAKENGQLICTIENLQAPVAVAKDKDGYIYILEKTEPRINKYSPNGLLLKSFGELVLKTPQDLIITKENILIIIDKDIDGFVYFDAEGNYLATMGSFTAIQDPFIPRAMVYSQKGFIYVSEESSQGIYQFTSDGSFLGQVLGFAGLAHNLAIDCQGNLWIIYDDKIAWLNGSVYYRSEGKYYSRTLDSGIEDCQWHRLSFEGSRPQNTFLKVYYHSSNDVQLKNAVDEILKDKQTNNGQKAASLDKIIDWTGPENNPPDMLIRNKAGRFLWLKIELATVDERLSPIIKQVKIYYPRISYLRYLPAVYQQDETSKVFLERFLSLFESVFYELESDISQIARYFDAQETPPDFLPYLASWLNLVLEEELAEERKRLLIQEAVKLYKIKGTLKAIARFIEIYSGHKPVIIEHARQGKPLVLGLNHKLGVDTLLSRTPIRGFRLGDDSIAGYVALRDEELTPEDPFLESAHQFTVLLSVSSQEFSSLEPFLRRIIDWQKPAHTSYSLRFMNEMKSGAGFYVGLTTRLGAHNPLLIGYGSQVGINVVALSGLQYGKVEKNALLGKTTKII